MQRVCDCCGRTYEAKRSTSRYCTDICRMRAKRGTPMPLHVVERPAEQQPKPDGSLLGSVLVALNEAGTIDAPAGRLAAQLAARLCDPNANDSGSAVAALARELRAVLAEAIPTRAASASPLDAIREGLRVV